MVKQVEHPLLSGLLYPGLQVGDRQLSRAARLGRCWERPGLQGHTALNAKVVVLHPTVTPGSGTKPNASTELLSQLPDSP